MSERVFPLAPFEGEDARGVVGDFGPFGIEMVAFQVFRARPSILFWKRGGWVTVKSTFFDVEQGIAKGYTFETWAAHKFTFMREWIEADLAEARARESFYG